MVNDFFASAETGIDPTSPLDCPNNATCPHFFGASDVLVSPNHALLWANRIPHAASRAVPGGGHWLRDQEPDLLAELFAVLTHGENSEEPGRSW